MSTLYFDYYGNPVSPIAAVSTTVTATAAGLTLTALAPFAQLQDTVGGDVLVGGPVSTNFIVDDPATTVIQGLHIGVSTVSAWISFTLPTGVDNLYEDGNNMTAVGAAGSENLLVAVGGRDILIGGSGGNDVLVDAGAGTDQFVLQPGGGHEVIYGFQATGLAQDFVNLSAYGYTSFNQVAPLLSQDGADTLLTLSATDSVLIRNTQVSSLTASDFMLALNTSGMTMTFDDEFNNLSLWNPSTGEGTWKTSFGQVVTSGAGSWASRTIASNNEQEIYVDPTYAGSGGGTTALGLNPFSTSNGVLTITASTTPTADLSALNNFQYTSGLLTTQNSFAQTYGYFEIRAELPTGQGVWPAFWLIPEAQVNADELDVVENVNGGPSVFQTAHWGPTSAPTQSPWYSMVSGLSTGFHTYGLLWTAQDLVWYIDGKAVAEMATPSTMNQPMYMLVNLAIGGVLPGAASSSLSSATMEVDYVHAYSLSGSGASGASDSAVAYTASSSTDAPTQTTVDTVYSAFSYTLPASSVHTLVLTGSGNLTATGNDLGDHITGNTGADTLIAGIGANVLDGSQGGNDLLNGAAGVDTLIGGAGNDTFVVGNSTDVVTAQAGYTNVIQTSVTFQAPANIQVIKATGNANISLWANGGGDVLTANGGNDTLHGGAGNDSFAAGSGVDTFVSGGGVDTFYLNNPADVIQGLVAGGRDVVETTFSYHLPVGAVELILESGGIAAWSNSAGGTLADAVGNDTLYGGAGNDSFIAAVAGPDTLVGGSGADTYFVQNSADVIQAGAGTTTVWADASYHLPDNILSGGLTGSANLSLWGGAGVLKLYANAGNDVIYAGSGADTLVGAAGADTFYGGAGNDSFVANKGLDTFVAGAGVDTFWVNNTADVVQGVPLNSKDLVQATASFVLPDNAAELVVEASGLAGWSNSTGATIVAGAGNDTLYGGAGSDSFISSSTGPDTMVGGAGADSYFVQNVSDVITPGTGTNTVWSSVSYRLPDNIQVAGLTGGAALSLWAGAGAIRLYANAGNDTLYSGSGVDTLIGGAASDTFVINNSADVVTAVAGHSNVLQTSVSFQTPSAILTVFAIGSANVAVWANGAGDVITGNAGNDTLYSGAGNDSLIGGSGVDTFVAGAGVDTFVVNNSADVIQGVPVGSHDIVQASASYQLPTNAAELILTGSASLVGTSNSTGATLVANGGSDTLYGGAGNDSFITSITGVDTLIGGAGADSYYVQNAADVITPGAGTSSIWATVSYHLPDNIQQAYLTGSANLSLWAGAGAERLYANAGNDVLYAGTGADTFVGAAGADTFYGGAGADSFVAGSGPDTFVAGTGTDAFWITSAADVIQGVPTGSQDIVQATVSYHLPANAVELVLSGSGNISGWSNSTGATLVGNSGNDVLYGGAGNDSFMSGSGVDTLIGGAGADSYFVQNSADVITPGAGTSTVWSNVSYQLPDNVQLAYLVGSANLSLWAGAGATHLYGNAGSNVLYAGSGADTLTGGAGNDTFVFGLGSAKDVITDFGQAGAHDVIDISAFLNAGDTASLSQSGGNALISLSNGEIITLLGVQASALTATAAGYMH